MVATIGRGIVKSGRLSEAGILPEAPENTAAAKRTTVREIRLISWEYLLFMV
jgi:hypothetical protein